MSEPIKSAIDELYEKYATVKPTYAQLRMDLEAINSPIINTDANRYYDPSQTSALAANRKDKLLSDVSKAYPKDTYYGIVLYVTGIANKKVYIDVPGKSPPILDEDLFTKNPNLDSDLYKQYQFEVDGLDILSSPVEGGIAIVKIPPNYPNHINTNLQEAVYLSMKRRTALVVISSSGNKVNNTAGNAFNAQNSAATYQIGGTLLSGKDRLNRYLNKQDVNGYFKGSPISTTVERIGPISKSQEYIDTNAAAAYRKMMSAYLNYVQQLDPSIVKTWSQDVQQPRVTSGFRSMEDQVRIKTQYPDRAAMPGMSNHQAGLAVDIMGTRKRYEDRLQKTAKGDSEFYQWMEKNAPKYGFKRTVSDEPWHWEFRNQWVNSREGDWYGKGDEPNTQIATS